MNHMNPTPRQKEILKSLASMNADNRYIEAMKHAEIQRTRHNMRVLRIIILCGMMCIVLVLLAMQ